MAPLRARFRARFQAIVASLLAMLPGCSSPSRPQSESARRVRIDELFREGRAKFPDVPLLSAAQIPELQRREKVVLVDVREPAEQAVSMIPGAITRAEFERDRAAHAGEKVVAYCTIGYRSGLYAAELRQQGVDAYDLEGSILAWTHAGLPLVDGHGPTRRVHVYGPRWDLAADGYEAVW